MAGNVTKVTSGEESSTKASSEEDSPLKGGDLKDDIGMEGKDLEETEESSVDGEVWACKREHYKFEEGLTFHRVEKKA